MAGGRQLTAKEQGIGLAKGPPADHSRTQKGNMSEVHIADAIRESTTVSGDGEHFTFYTDSGRRIDARLNWGLVEQLMIEAPCVRRIFLMPKVTK